MGLVAGLASLETTAAGWINGLLIGLVLAVLAVGDHPGLLRRYRQQVVNLDQAYADETALRAALEGMLGGRVHRVAVIELDLVNDTTKVDVRFEVPRKAGFDTPPAAALNPREREVTR